MRYIEFMTETHRPAPVLVVVHPDSTCGSADFNLGEDEAAEDRTKLIADLEGWQGGVIILDGGLRRELVAPAYQPLQGALTAVLQRAKASNQIAIRRVAADPAQRKVMQQIVPRLDPHTQFYLTGAWFHPEDSAGCVGDVLDVLRAAGFAAKVRPSAFIL
jgi:hypothetical protein